MFFNLQLEVDSKVDPKLEQEMLTHFHNLNIIIKKILFLQEGNSKPRSLSNYTPNSKKTIHVTGTWPTASQCITLKTIKLKK